MIREAIQVERKMHKTEEGSDIDSNWELENADIQAKKEEFEKDLSIIEDVAKQTADATKVIADFVGKQGMYEEAIGSEELGSIFRFYELESSFEMLSEKIQEFQKRNSSK